MSFEYSDPIIVNRRTGSSESPYVSKTDTLIINNDAKVILVEIPDSFQKVQVSGESVTWIEATGVSPTANEFVVDYTNRIVTFHISRIGLQLTFSYMGTGLQYIPPSAIYTENSNGEITETLKTLTDSTTLARDGADAIINNFIYRDIYDNNTQYYTKNIISYQGSTYIANTDTLGNLPTDANYWQKLTSFTWRGTYSPTESYVMGDYVSDTNNYNIYLALTDVGVGSDLLDVTKWEKVINAEDVINNVITATSAANTATDNANIATTNTGIATTNADNASTNANDKAIFAQTQGDYAQLIGDSLVLLGNYDPLAEYKNLNMVYFNGQTYMCIANTIAGTDPTNGIYWTVISQQATINDETWVASEGQTVFTITNGSYLVGEGHLEVWVGGVPQIEGQGFTETGSTSFALSEGVSVGIGVFAKWLEGAISITKSHHITHETGGTDELDVTNLYNYTEYVKDRLDGHTTQLADITKQVVYVNDTMTMAQIQTKADSLINGGILNFVYSANYNITQTIVIKPNTTVEGNNSKITVTTDIEVFKTLGEINVGYSKIHIKNFEIWDSGLIARTKYHINLINPILCSVKNVKIYGLTLTQNDVAGIYLSRYGANVSSFVNEILGCLLNQASIKTESTDSWITKNTIWAYSRGFGIHVVKPSQFINENQIVGSSINGAIYLKDTFDNFNLELIKITNNFFDGSYSTIDSGYGITGDKITQSIISNNDFWQQMDEGIKLTSSNTTKIIGNTFKDCNRRDLSRNDITFLNCEYMNIAENSFTRTVLHTNKGNAVNSTGGSYNIYLGNHVFFSSYYLSPQIIMENDTKILLNVGGGADNLKTSSKTTLNYWLDSVVANLLSTTLNSNGSSMKSYIIGYSSKVLAINLAVNTPRVTGSLILEIIKNGVATGQTLTYSNNFYAVNKTLAEPLNISSSDVLSIRATTTSDWSPTLNISVSLLIEINI